MELGYVKAQTVLCQMTLLMEDASESESLMAPMIWLVAKGHEFHMVGADCLNPSDVHFMGAVSAYRKWHKKMDGRTPTKMVEQFMQHRLASRLNENKGELRSPDRRFSLSPVQMRISPIVLMRKALPAEIQVVFQLKMVQFFIRYDGVLDNCIHGKLTQGVWVHVT